MEGSAVCLFSSIVAVIVVIVIFVLVIIPYDED
jgi:hypothetical protein